MHTCRPQRRGQFEAAWHSAEGLEKPFDLALLALADGRHLRVGGKRRTAIERLRRARDTFASLRAQPYLDAASASSSISALPPRPTGRPPATA